jgi:hypothetical protein
MNQSISQILCYKLLDVVKPNVYYFELFLENCLEDPFYVTLACFHTILLNETIDTSSTKMV